MINVNVEVNSKPWHKKVKSPKIYLNNRLKKISRKIPLFKKKNITFTILLTNSLNMKKLNRKFRNCNKSTDVLSFPYSSSNNLKLIKKKKVYLGDIAASYEIIKKRSNQKNFLLEFDKVWIHGFLHLLGYDHFTNKDFSKMNKLEKKILKVISQ